MQSSNLQNNHQSYTQEKLDPTSKHRIDMVCLAILVICTLCSLLAFLAALFVLTTTSPSSSFVTLCGSKETIHWLSNL
jgi:hypothetical protein